jgi:hypothetical protein
MCGCNSIGGGGTKAFVNQSPTQGPAQSYVGGATQLPQQFNVNDGRMRDQQRAQMVLQQLRAATQHLQTPEQARAAGYKPNPSSPDHWINDDIFAVRNGYDLSRPATVMFENGRLVGVMLSHDPMRGAPPDLGAGSWHTHGGTAGREYAAHVWFNKPLQTAFGTETGDV